MFVGEILFVLGIVVLGLLLTVLLIGNMQNFLLALSRRYVIISSLCYFSLCKTLDGLCFIDNEGSAWDGAKADISRTLKYYCACFFNRSHSCYCKAIQYCLFHLSIHANLGL